MPVPSGSFRSRSTAAGRALREERAGPRPRRRRPGSCGRARSSSSTQALRTTSSSSMTRVGGRDPAWRAAAWYHPLERSEYGRAIAEPVGSWSSLRRGRPAGAPALRRPSASPGPTRPRPRQPARALVSVTVEYRQPERLREGSPRCDDPVVFFGSWMQPGRGVPPAPGAGPLHLAGRRPRRARELPAARRSPTPCASTIRTSWTAPPGRHRRAADGRRRGHLRRVRSRRAIRESRRSSTSTRTARATNPF